MRITVFPCFLIIISVILQNPFLSATQWNNNPQVSSCDSSYNLGNALFLKGKISEKNTNPDQKYIEALVLSWFLESETRLNYLNQNFSLPVINRLEIFTAAVKGKKWTLHQRLKDLKELDSWFTATDIQWLKAYAEKGLNAPAPAFQGLKLLISTEYYLENENLAKAGASFREFLVYFQKQKFSESLHISIFTYFLKITSEKLLESASSASLDNYAKTLSSYSVFLSSLNECFRTNSVPVKLSELRQMLSNLNKLTHGKIQVPGGLDYEFTKAGSKYLFNLFVHGNRVLSSHGPENNWFIKDIAYDTRRIFTHDTPDNVTINPDLIINRNESGGNISFNLSAGLERPARFSPERFSLFFGDGLYIRRTVSKEGQNTSFISPFNLRNPLKRQFAIITHRNNSVEELSLYNGFTGNTLSFSNLGYSQKPPETSKPGLPVLTPLPSAYYQIALGKIFLKTSTQDERKGGTDRELELFVLLQKNSEKIFKGSTTQVKEVADYFYSLNEKYKDSPTFFKVVGWLYAQCYNYRKAALLFEELFYKSENINSKSTRSVNLPGLSDEITFYAWLLSQSGEYSKAAGFLEEYLIKARRAHDNENFLIYAYQLSDIYFRQTRYNEAMRIIREAIHLKSPSLFHPEKKQFAEAGMVILGYLANAEQLKTFHGDIVKEGIFPAESFPALRDAIGATPIRLKNLTNFPGEGKNFCIPIALQFILNYYGDKKTTQKEIATEIGTGESGSDFHGFMAYLNKKQFQVVSFSGGYEKTSDYLKKGIPVITLLEPEGSDIGHATVLIGADTKSQNYYMYEPGNKFALYTMRAIDLEKRQKTSGRLYFAVMPPNSAKSAPQDTETPDIVTYYDQISSKKGNEAFQTLRKAMESTPEKSVHRVFFRTQWLKSAVGYPDFPEKPEETLKKYANAVNTATEFFLLGEVANKAGLDPHMYYERAVQADANNPYATIRIAESYARKKDYKRAKEFFLKGLSNAKHFTNYANLEIYIYSILGKIAIQENDYQTAVKYLLAITPAEKLSETMEREKALLEKSPDKHLPDFLRKFVVN